MSDNNLSGKVTLDTTDYKTGVAELNRHIRTIESGFRASASAMGDWSKSAEGLELRNQALNTQMDIQKEKIAALSAEYERIVAEKGADSRAAEELKIKIDNATTSLNGMSNEIQNNIQKSKELNDQKVSDHFDELDQKLKLAKSEFDLATASMGDWSKSAEGVTARNKYLNDAISIQKEKIQSLNSELKPNSAAYVTQQTSVNNATAELKKMETELKQNEKALNDDRNGTKKLGDEQAKAEKKTLSFKDAMKGLGTVLASVGKALAAVAAAAFAAIGAMVGMVLKSAQMADELDETSQKTGISVERLQELGYIAKQTGTDLETITGANAKLIRSMDSAKEGTGAQAEAFKKLGISVKDSSGNLRNSQDVFQEALTKLGGMSNETERDAAAMALFGKSAQELNPLIKTSAEELARLTDEAHKNGAVMSDKAVAGLAALNDTVDGLKSGLKGIAGEIAATFAPVIQTALDGMMGYLGRFSKIATESFGKTGGSAASMATGFSNIFKDIIKDIAGKAPEMLEGGLGFVKGIMDAVIGSLPILLPMVVTMLQTLVQFIVQSLPMLIDAAILILLMLTKSLISMLPMLLTAAIQIIVQLANGISSALPTLIPTVIGILMQLVLTLVENLPMLINAAMQLILALSQGLIAALPVLMDMLPTIMIQLVEGLLMNLGPLLLAAAQIILTLGFGIIENIPKLLTMMPKVINALVEKFKSPEFKAQMKTIGVELINGLKDGWNNAWGSFTENITKNWNEMIGSLKKLLGIASPAKIMIPIGGSLPDGAGVGWLASFKNLKRLVADSMLELTTMSAANLGGLTNNAVFSGAGGGQFSSQTDTYQFFAPVILQGGAGVSLGQTIKSKRY